MSKDKIQALNYCAHAIEDIQNQISFLKNTAPESAKVMQNLIGLLKDSVKFILPNCCGLIDPDELRQSHLDLTRLPFPVVAFEAPWELDDGITQIGEYVQTPATKRIALCWSANPAIEPVPGLNEIFKVFPEGGIFVVPIYWAADYRHWTVAIGGSFIPYENTLKEMVLDECLPASRIAHSAAIEAGITKKKIKQFKAEPFFLLPEFYRKILADYGGSREKTYAQIILDSRDEVQVVIQACSVMNCANVTTEDVGPSVTLNKIRQKKGKQPFFTYKVLQLLNEGREASGSGSGAHSSPRMHLRRGHLRRLEDKVIWVRPSIVNAGSKDGVVIKDYAIKSHE